jgi:DNA (cytosine-5)-methyltransferase 1
MTGLIIDNFAGGGGASTGIEAALGRKIDVAINHDPEAVAMHLANHPDTLHYCQSVWRADPLDVTGGKPVDLAWFSPDCKHFSKAKGGKPVEKHIRDLAWVVVLWAQRVRPTVIMLENVEEFRTWGPLLEDGKPCPARRGTEFQRWLKALRKAGYKVEHRELRACDYGAPTSRKRLFLIARNDGRPIVWPEPTHGRPGTPDVVAGRLKPWRTAAEIIDWTRPCPSIFERARPLKDATCRRIATGIVRYVLNAARPFIVPITHAGDVRVHSADEPLRTITTARRGELAAIAPSFVRTAHGDVDAKGKRRGQGSHSIDEPFPTITASRDSALVAASMVQTGYGERPGQAPRALDIEAPLGTVVGGGKHGLVAAFMEKFSQNSRGKDAQAPLDTAMAGAARHAVVAAHMAQHNAGNGAAPRSCEAPLSTITGRGTQQNLVTSNLVKLRGTSKDGQPTDDPLHTVSAGGTHFGEVRAFLTKYYGSAEHGQAADEPMGAATSKARFGLVTVEIDGQLFALSDIGMRMLSPRELFAAQGFPPSYIIDTLGPNGKPLTKTAQIRMCGNSVSPPMAEALVRANVPSTAEVRQAA